MRKEELVKLVAKNTGLSGRKVKLVIDAFLEEISRSLERGERVELRGFGVFRVNTYQAKEMVVPATGKRIQLPVRLFPHFKPGKILKERVRR